MPSAIPFVVFEAPHRLVASLKDAREVLGPRHVVACRELTKVHEEHVRGSLDERRSRGSSGTPPRGEFTLVFAAASEDDRAVASDEDTVGCLDLAGILSFDQVWPVATRRDRRAGTPPRPAVPRDLRLGRAGQARFGRSLNGWKRIAGPLRRRPYERRAAHRHSRRGQGDADEVRPAQGAPCRRRRADDLRTCCAPPARWPRRRRRSLLVIWPIKLSGRVGSPAIQTVRQEPQKGTAHALLQTESLLSGATGTLVLVYGDVPLLSTGTLRRLVDHHHATAATATVLTARVANPTGYGRIVRDTAAALPASSRNGTRRPRSARSPRSTRGIYAFDAAASSTALHRITPQNAQAEYYLTDLVGIFRQRWSQGRDPVPRQCRRAARRQQPRGAGRDERRSCATPATPR